MPNFPTGAKRPAEVIHNSSAPKAIDNDETAPPGSAKRILDWLRKNPVRSLRRSAEEIDAGIEAERNGWD